MVHLMMSLNLKQKSRKIWRNISKNASKRIQKIPLTWVLTFTGLPPTMATCFIDSCTIGFLMVLTLNFAYNNNKPDVVKQTMAVLLESTYAIECENVSNWNGIFFRIIRMKKNSNSWEKLGF